MAKKKSVLTKKQQNQIKKAAKKNPKIFIIGLVAVLVIGGIGVGVYFYLNREKPREPIDSGEIQINVLELGNKNNGDCIFIQCGSNDIIIDGGSTKGSAPYLTNYIDSKITDNTIEYLIVTHADSDHISALVGSNGNGIFDHYKVNNIIQFSKTNKSENNIYKEYVQKRDNEVSEGAKLYFANDLIQNKTNIFDFGNNLKMTILDQKYYREETTDENNYSVCTLFTQGINNYLFTGDLEKSGEASLVELNDLPKCELFKAGHHGSRTASNDVLLDVIQPKNVFISCDAGYNEYHSSEENVFPAKDALDRIFKHTNNVYVTTMYNGESAEPLNGTITLKCKSGDDYTIEGSNNSTKLKDTDWFDKNRKN